MQVERRYCERRAAKAVEITHRAGIIPASFDLFQNRAPVRLGMLANDMPLLEPNARLNFVPR